MAEFTPLETFREAAGQPDLDRSLRIREEFRARIATMAPDEGGRRPFDPFVLEGPTPPPARRFQPVMALAALALVVGLAAGGAFWMRDGASAGSFTQLASDARQQPDVALDDGQYLYVAERISADDTGTQREQWTARNGTGQATESAMTLQAPGTSAPSLTVYSTPGSLEFANMSYDELRTLPSDPDALLARLAALGMARTDDPTGQAGALAAILALDVTPPGVRAASVQALERIGGTTTGSVTDVDGRAGAGIRGDNGDGTSWLLVVDPAAVRALAFHPGTTASSTGADGRVWTDQHITTSLPG